MKHIRRTVFLHICRCVPHISGARFQKHLHRISQRLAGAVVQVCLHDPHGALVVTVFSSFYFHRFIRQKHRPQDIRVREILISGADTDLFDLVLLRKRRFCPECRRDRRAGRRYHLSFDIPKRQFQALCRCDICRRRNRNRH